MNSIHSRFIANSRIALVAALLAAAPFSAMSLADSAEPAAQAAAESYDRVLPLEGGSNFRDMGGLYTADGYKVRHGLLFRSGVMTSLTEVDMAYLDEIDFETIVDLRSSEERELYPNHWAAESDVELVAHDYSMRDLMKRAVDEDGKPTGNAMHEMYKTMPYMLEPQLKLFFAELVDGNAPLVVNCSAGQDRTGISSALLLLALGVPEEVVVQDYLNSTRFRRPVNERGDVDLQAAAEENFFAAVMLRYSGGSDEVSPARPLLTEQRVPYLRFALDQIEQDFGSVEGFLQERIDVGPQEIARLRRLYLETPWGDVFS